MTAKMQENDEQWNAKEFSVIDGERTLIGESQCGFIRLGYLDIRIHTDNISVFHHETGKVLMSRPREDGSDEYRPSEDDIVDRIIAIRDASIDDQQCDTCWTKENEGHECEAETKFITEIEVNGQVVRREKHSSPDTNIMWAEYRNNKYRNLHLKCYSDMGGNNDDRGFELWLGNVKLGSHSYWYSEEREFPDYMWGNV